MTHASRGPSAHAFTPDERLPPTPVMVQVGARPPARRTSYLAYPAWSRAFARGPGPDAGRPSEGRSVRRAAHLLVALAMIAATSYATPTAAQEAPAPVRASIVQGEYASAFEMAGAVPGVEGLLLQAEAANLQAHYAADGEEERRAWSERAARAAREAIEAAPTLAQGHFELARAEGTMAASSGIAQNLNRAGELRDLFEHTLGLDPDHAGARMALAQWHLELSERGVAWLFGGDGSRVLPLARSAVEVAPDRIDLRVEFASVLQRLGRVDEAAVQLQEALSSDPASHADRLELARARRLLAELSP